MVLGRNLPERSLGQAFWTFFGVQKMIKLRLIDIRVDVFGNPFFQKCRGTSLVSENGLNTKNTFIFNLFSRNRVKKRENTGQQLIQEYSLLTPVWD